MTVIAIDRPRQAVVNANPQVATLGQGNHRQCYGNSRQGWIVVATHSRAELWADQNLRTRGYRTFLPLMAVRVRDRVVPTMFHTTEVPLFAGYLFCWYDERDPRRPIRETPGVRDVIRCGPEVQYAPEAAVSALQATQDARRCLPAENAQWAPGMPCSLRKGYAFEGLPAVVLSTEGDIARISVLMFGHLRPISVPFDCLVGRDE